MIKKDIYPKIKSIKYKNMMAKPLFKTINKFSNRLQKIKISLQTIRKILEIYFMFLCIL